MNYINNRKIIFDVEKGVAMIAIILCHLRQSFPDLTNTLSFLSYGQFGSQVLFVVAGFFAANSFSKLIEENNFKSASIEFYKKRLKSIAPAWYFMMIVIFVLNSLSYKFIGKSIGFSGNRSFLGILVNVLFLNGIFPKTGYDVMPGGWFIGTIMIFYLFTPLLFNVFSSLSLS